MQDLTLDELVEQIDSCFEEIRRRIRHRRGRKNIGGLARTQTWSLYELSEAWDDVAGVARRWGHDDALETLREEVTKELQDELERFDPECDLCAARREISELTAQLARQKAVAVSRPRF
jgi:hypothetical protein